MPGLEWTPRLTAACVLATALLAFSGFRSMAGTGPLKVFALVGQSNMEGQAAAYTLDAAINDPRTRAEFEHLQPNGKWLIRDDVFVTFLDKKTTGQSEWPLHGPLTVGFGAQKQMRDANNRRVTVPSFGPELGIGQVLGDHFEEPVLLIKAAWGGRAVKYSFRPPSAMPSDEEIKAEVSGIEARRKAQLKRDQENANPNKKRKPAAPEVTFESRKAGYGADYRKVLAEMRRVLDNPGKYFPGYDPELGFEIAGFIWFQGWNDAVGAGNPDYVEHMAHFIRDIRRDLDVPDLPFVIGELGIDGPEAQGWIATFREQQAAVAALPEFKDTVRLAPTAQFWPTNLPDLGKQWAAFRDLARQNEEKAADDPSRIDPGTFFHRNWLMKYRQELSYTSDKRYHYLGSGTCYYQMGRSMGEAMVDLQPRQPQPARGSLDEEGARGLQELNLKKELPD